MVQLMPLPYSIATSVPNVGLINNLATFSTALGTINQLPQSTRTQMLDDTNATLRGHQPLSPLAQRIDRHIAAADYSGPRQVPPLVNTAVQTLMKARTRAQLGPNATAKEFDRAFHSIEIIRFLGNWAHTTVAVRRLTLDMAEQLLRPIEGFEEFQPEIDQYRRALAMTPTLAENATLIRDIQIALPAIDASKYPWVRQLALSFSDWTNLGDAPRRRLLEQTKQAFNSYYPYADLSEEIQNLEYAHIRQQRRTNQISPIVVPPDLLVRILSALKDIDKTRGAQLDNTQMQTATDRLRLITRPITTENGNSPIVLRAPTRMVGRGRNVESLLHEIGKVIPQLWENDPEEAQAIFNHWFRPTDRPAHAREVHVFTDTLEEAERRAWQLANKGFDVRLASFPAYLNGTPTADPTKIDIKQAMYFVIGRSSSTQVARWIRQFVYKENWDEATRRVVKTAEPPRIEHIDIGDELDLPFDSDETQQLLEELFHRRVSVRDIRDAFGTDIRGHVTSRVKLKRFNTNGVHISAEISAEDGTLATSLEGWIPKLPQPGEHWVAWGESIRTEMDPARKKQSTDAGLSRRAMQRIIAFLYQLGVNALDMKARDQGMTFMPYIGFDFESPEVRRRVFEDFDAFLQERNISLSPDKQAELNEVKHAWELLEFLLEDRTRIGREFFDSYSRTHESLPLRFSLRPDYEGFTRLFSNQLARSGELEKISNEPEQSEEERIRADEHKKAQHRRLKELRQSPILFDPTVPTHVRALLAEALDLADIHATAASIHLHDSEHDDKTGLETYGKLMSQNGVLERSMLNPRGEDRYPDGRVKEHYVIMIDIDHFSRVNNNHGHPVGDDVLRQVTDMIRDEARPTDIVSRYGGEEFCLVARHCGAEGAKKMAERIRERIMQNTITSNAGGKPVSLDITVSLGVAPFRIIENGGNGSGDELSEVKEKKTSLSVAISNADTVLYRAKRNGRNRVEYFVDALALSDSQAPMALPWYTRLGRFLNIFRRFRNWREQRKREKA